MKKSTRVWLVIAICFTVYLIYLAGSAATYDYNGGPFVEAVPFDHLERYQFQHLLTWALGSTLISWVVWGVKFIREAK